MNDNLTEQARRRLWKRLVYAIASQSGWHDSTMISVRSAARAARCGKTTIRPVLDWGCDIGILRRRWLGGWKFLPSPSLTDIANIAPQGHDLLHSKSAYLDAYIQIAENIMLASAESGKYARAQIWGRRIEYVQSIIKGEYEEKSD